MKNCKIISTCFNDNREIREQTTFCGIPSGLYNHSQKFPTKESVLNLIKLNVEQELTVDAGLEVDTIIINNDTGWIEGNNFLNSLHNTTTKNGKLLIEHRKNFGRAFGGYNYAFEKYKNIYDNWIFTEDDVLINSKIYYKKLLEEYNTFDRIGCLAIIGYNFENFRGQVGSEFMHAHGSVGLYKKNILEKIYAINNGSLPHVKEHESQNYANQIEFGEIKFSNTVKKINLDIIKSMHKTYNFAYDFIRNINIS